MAANHFYCAQSVDFHAQVFATAVELVTVNFFFNLTAYINLLQENFLGRVDFRQGIFPILTQKLTLNISL